MYHAQLRLFYGYELRDFGKNNFLHITGFKSLLLNVLPTVSGWNGLQLFLLISGFGIHYGFLSSNQKLDIFSFFSKRFWRLYPAYFFVLLVFCFIEKGVNYYLFSSVGLKDLLAHLFLIQNLSDRFYYTINPSFWSLALEIQFYLVYPLFLFIRKKLGIKKAMFVVILVCPMSYSACSIIFRGHINLAQNFFLNIWFIWCTGAFLAERYFNGVQIFKKASLPLAALGFLITILSKFYRYTSNLSSLFAAFTCLVFIEWFLYNNSVNTRLYIFKIFAVIGMCSYSIYLIHQPCLAYVLNWFNFLSLSSLFVFIKIIPAFIVIFSIAFLMYSYIEVPFIKFGSYLRRRKNISMPVNSVIVKSVS